MKIFPWQQEKWRYLVKRINSLQMPHAILLQGGEGLGKMHFALCLAELLLCDGSKAEGFSCGNCTSCQLLNSNNHPDLIVVKSESSGKAIKIDQIRELIVSLNNTSHQCGNKVVIIESAELLNTAAANALLKTLEEPDPNTVIVLVSAHPMTLPATIRSRCQILSMNVSEYDVVKQWLQNELGKHDVDTLLSLTENAPLKAKSIVSDGGLEERQEFFGRLVNLQIGKMSLIKVASECSKLGLDNLIMLFMHAANDLIKLQFEAVDTVVNQDQLKILNRFAQKTNLKKLFIYRDKLAELRRHIIRKINLNQQIVVESLLIGWTRLFV